jgi:hypothetical protein
MDDMPMMTPAFMSGSTRPFYSMMSILLSTAFVSLVFPPATTVLDLANFRSGGSWFVVRGSWFVVRGSWFVVRGSWFVVRGSWFVVRGSWFVVIRSVGAILTWPGEPRAMLCVPHQYLSRSVTRSASVSLMLPTAFEYERRQPHGSRSSLSLIRPCRSLVGKGHLGASEQDGPS